MTCKECTKPTEQTVNGYCPVCWAAGPAIKLKQWLEEKHGFNFNEDYLSSRAELLTP